VLKPTVHENDGYSWKTVTTFQNLIEKIDASLYTV